MKTTVYILDGLDCANCAAKIERKLSKMKEISEVSITYSTKQSPESFTKIPISAKQKAEKIMQKIPFTLFGIVFSFV